MNLVNAMYVYIVLIYYGSFKDAFKDEMFDDDSDNIDTSDEEEGAEVDEEEDMFEEG